jgi:phosphatidylinositol alpha-1,6-mannosyltransferase
MKIIYLSHLHPPIDAPLKNMGGMQRVSLQLIETLKRNPGIHVETIKLEADWGTIGFETTKYLLKNLVNLPSVVYDTKPDIILFSSMVTASLAPLIKKRIDVPMVSINHGQDVTLPVKIYQWYLKYIFKALDGVISVSNATRDACILRGMDPSKGIAIPNGFMQDDFSHSQTSPEQARKFLSDFVGTDLSNKKILLTTGRLVKRKGHEWFISEVLPHVKKDSCYVILGDGPEKESIVKAVQNSSVKQHVIMLGRQPDDVLQKMYEAADLFIMPNIKVPGDMEGFGVVMLEANLMGTPVVASDLEGIKDVVADGYNGYKVPVGDAVSFSSKINELLDSDLTEISASSKSYVFDNFTWDKVSLKYIHFISSIAQKSKNA